MHCHRNPREPMGKVMQKTKYTWVAVIAMLLHISLATAQESKDLLDKNGEYTGRAIAIAAVAGAQVVEMRCGVKGWIAATIKKFDKLGVHVDLNEKQDYSDTIYFATGIIKKADKIGASQWCKDTMPLLGKMLEEP